MKNLYVSPMMNVFSMQQEDVLTSSLNIHANGEDMVVDWNDRVRKIG